MTEVAVGLLASWLAEARPPLADFTLDFLGCGVTSRGGHIRALQAALPADLRTFSISLLDTFGASERDWDGYCDVRGGWPWALGRGAARERFPHLRRVRVQVHEEDVESWGDTSSEEASSTRYGRSCSGSSEESE